MKSYQPAAGWVLLQAEELAEQTPGGIVKPQIALERERSLGAENAPCFLVLANGGEPVYRNYPVVGSRVFVLNKPMSIVVLNKSMLFVEVNCIVGSVTEENA